MKNVYLRLIQALLVLIIAAPALAQMPAPDPDGAPVNDVPADIRQAIGENLKKSRPTLTFEFIKASPIPGVYAVKVVNGPTLYATGDGRYFVYGDLYEVTDSGYVNIAEQDREKERAEKLANIPIEDMIVFSPEEQPAKASIMVFTDVDCFYCQKLHKEVPDLNRLGIEVRYLAYPRAGLGSDSYKKIVSAWCSKDRRTAITKLKNRESIPTNLCPDNPVAEQFKLGMAIGVSGTPALVTQEGRLMPGYMPALQLANALGVEVDPALAAEIAAKQGPPMR